MKIILIPGFMGYPKEATFTTLEDTLTKLGHEIETIAWPNFPNNLSEYNFSNTIDLLREKLQEEPPSNMCIIGFSMGGIIATILASEIKPSKLGLIVSPYQAAKGDDLENLYDNWINKGYFEIKSSKFGKLRIPSSFIVDARRYNALEYTPKITSKVLFVVGEKDKQVKNESSKELYNQITSPKKWIKIPNMIHKYKNQPEKLKLVNNEIVKFIQK